MHFMATTDLLDNPSINHATGVMLVCVSAIVFSTAGIFTNAVEADAWGVIFWRGLSAALFTIFFAVSQNSLADEWRRFHFPAILATILLASGTAAFIPAFKLTSIANVSLIWAASPILTALLAWITLREKPSAKVMGASIVAMG
jgi:drug/metabolite transporter (DMT)-like permease